MRSGTLWRLNVAFLLLYGMGVVLTWSDVPGRIPMHFGLDGEADRWTERAGLIWFGLPALAAALAVFIRTLGRFAVRNPEIWNVPRKEFFLRLSPDQRAPVVESLESYLAGTSLAMGCLFAALQAGVYTTATGRSDGLSGWFVFVSVAAVVGILIGAFLLRRRIVRQIREAKRMVSREGSGQQVRAGSEQRKSS